MARATLGRPLAAALAAAIIFGLAAQANARFLVINEEGILDDTAGSALTVSEAQDGQAKQPSDPASSFGTIASLPYSWFQHQLMILEALQQAVVQSIQQVDSSDEGAFENHDSATQDEQLRHVGYARLRAALRKEAALEAGFDASDSVASGAAAAAVGAATASAAGTDWQDGHAEEDEYYEDYALSHSRSAQLSLLGGSTSDSSSSAGEVESEREAHELMMAEDEKYSRLFSSTEPEAEEAEAEGAGSGESAWTVAPESTANMLVEEYDSYYDDDFEYDLYGDDGVYENDGYEFTYDLSEINEDVDIDRELSYIEDKYPAYEYTSYEDYEEVMTLADAMLSKFELDAQEAEWADYLEQAYEYFTLYLDDDLYLSYSDSYDDADWYTDAAPDPVAVLASIAELVVWAHVGNFVLEVRPGYSLIQADCVFGSAAAAGVEPSAGDIDPAFAAMFFDQMGEVGPDDVSAFFDAQQQPSIVNRFDTQLVYPDGSINWELVLLVVLASGTVAMMVGFVVSWLSLRRSMGSRWVYSARGPSGRGGKGGESGASKGTVKEGYEWGGELGTPLRPEDCHGAVCWGAPTVEYASTYVSGKQSNDSVAKALCK